MTPPILTFFNNKGGVGKTSLVYHLAWMCADLGKTVLMVDLDPQATLTAAILTEEKIDTLWNPPKSAIHNQTLYQCVAPPFNKGELLKPLLQKISPKLHLIPGDLRLSEIEDALSSEWPKSLGDKNLYGALSSLSVFW